MLQPDVRVIYTLFNECSIADYCDLSLYMCVCVCVFVCVCVCSCVCVCVLLWFDGFCLELVYDVRPRGLTFMWWGCYGLCL